MVVSEWQMVILERQTSPSANGPEGRVFVSVYQPFCVTRIQISRTESDWPYWNLAP